MKKLIFQYGVLLIFPLTSCMTIQDSGVGRKTVFATTIKTEPVRAVCHITPPAEDEVGGHRWATVETVETPVTLYFDAWETESFEIMCEAEGYDKATVTTKPRLSGWLLLNAFLGLSMPIGVVTDLATKSAWQYPGSVSIELEPTEAVTD